MKRTNFMMLVTILATVMTTACNNEAAKQNFYRNMPQHDNTL